ACEREGVNAYGPGGCSGRSVDRRDRLHASRAAGSRGRTRRVRVRFWAVAGLLAVAVVARAEDAIDVERRVVSFIGKSIVPGTPLVVSDLYNKAFTQPEERKVLDKLNKAAFRLPLFLVEQQAALRRPPTLKEISDQFGFFGPEESDVVLRILESDPRVPRFFERDARTKEIVSVDAAKIKADPRFGKV